MAQQIGYDGENLAWNEFPRHQYGDGDVTYKMTARPRVGRGPRGRPGLTSGINSNTGGLFELVSSRMARDIKRNKNWIAARPFDIWNEKDMKANGGKQRYWGALEDYDNDGYEMEYVVRRGGANGPIVAVNGYTTTQSDYPWRYQYFNEYPTREARKQVSFRKYINDYYGPTYGSDGMSISHWARDPSTDVDTQAALKHGYKNVVPKARSPYRAFSNIVHAVLNELIAENAAARGTTPKEYRKQIADASGKGFGFASVIVSAVYDSFINAPIFNLLRSNGMIDQYKQVYEALQKQKDPNYEFDEDDDNKAAAFNKWLMSKADWKKAARDLAVRSVSDENIEATKANLKQLIATAINQLIK